jgi:hypothetical protein
MKRQTAVEWFNEQVQIERSRGFISNERYNELFEQAKKMNKILNLSIVYGLKSKKRN